MKIIPKTIPINIVSWAGSFPFAKYLKGFSWNTYANVLYTQTPTNQFNVWLNVVRNVATSLLYAANPDAYYLTYINNVQTPCLLTENCVPLICENGTFLVL